jgi:DNA-binding response OmpR family regulator
VKEEMRLHTPVSLGGSKFPPSGNFDEGFSPGRSRQQTGTVLVVDDERLIADTLTAILEEHGFIAMAAYNGEEGLEIARTMRPDIVLSDVLMPGISGIEMAIRLKQTLDTTKIVLLSGQASTAQLIQGAENAGHHFELLAKPIHPDELVAKLKQILRSNRR